MSGIINKLLSRLIQRSIKKNMTFNLAFLKKLNAVHQFSAVPVRQFISANLSPGTPLLAEYEGTRSEERRSGF